MDAVSQILICGTRINAALLKGVEEHHAILLEQPCHIAGASCVSNQRAIAIIQGIAVTDERTAVKDLTVMGGNDQNPRIGKRPFSLLTASSSAPV